MNTRRYAELVRTFVLPPRLNVAPPRAVRLSAAGVSVAALAAVLFAGAGVSFVLLSRESARQAANRHLLSLDGVRAEGAVARLWRDGDNRRQVEYRFEVQSRSYVGRANVSDAVRRTLQVGSPVTVRYVPSNPRLNDLGSRRSGLPAAIAPVVAVLCVAAGGLCVYGVQRQRRLLMDGRIAPGIVTALRKSHTSHDGDHKVIEFEFRTLNGAIRRGRGTPSSKSQAVGAVVCVLYDPDRPERHAVFPFSLVTPAT